MVVSSELLRWFSKNERHFPWRKTFDNPDPYIILFTEMMLLRTKANQVVPVYNEFVRKYPTFNKLARASNREISSLFSPLGLKWRAKRIIKLTQYLDQHYNGRVPDDFAELRELPGVGDYVAKAVLCYAFGRREGPVDTNVVRVVTRLFGKPQNPDVARRNKIIAELTASLVPKGDKNARRFNLALLDLGALVCKPKPLCDKCPLNSYCEYYQQNRPRPRAE